MTRHCRFLMIVAVAILTVTFGPSRTAWAGGISNIVLLTNPWIICDRPPSEVSFLPNTLGTASQGNYTFAVDATLNGSPFAAAGSTVPGSLYFSPAPSGNAGLVPGTGVAVPGTTLLEQSVDFNFNIVDLATPTPVVLLAGELKGLLIIDTSTSTGTIALDPVPSPWISDLVYAGNPVLVGVGTPFTLDQIATLDGGPLGITAAGNITPFSSGAGTGQFSIVPEPSSLVTAALGLGAAVTAGLGYRRSARPSPVVVPERPSRRPTR
jgi:hypothetical protein